ncbi:unnamed protein product, partial [Effrenium voratum]
VSVFQQHDPTEIYVKVLSPAFEREWAAASSTDVSSAGAGRTCPACHAPLDYHIHRSWSAAIVLLINLERQAGQDIGKHCQLDLKSLSSIQLQGQHYRLRAAMVHRGASADAGHYVAFVKQKDCWVRYNDGDTPQRLSSAPVAVATHSRLLVYERCGVARLLYA